MNNNRLTIISPRDKRRKIKYTIIMFGLLAVIITISCLLGFGYFTKNNPNKVTNSVSNITTTKTTTTTSTTTTTVVTTTSNSNPTNNYIYNFSLVDNQYKIFVCNGDNISRMTNYKIYSKNILLGEEKDLNGLFVNKNIVNLANTPELIIEINNKKYRLKYDDRC